MNYLAHAWLSFNNPPVLVGNMISDYVKGKAQFDYPSLIQVGIRLHRDIDDFTDHHQATKEMMMIFRPQYRLYSGAFVDIVYDYFLANDRNEFQNEEALELFTKETYNSMQNYITLFPEKYKQLFPYMVSQNWLYNYQYDHGIQKSFNGLVRRAAYLKESEIAFDLFLKNKIFLQEQYNIFFKAVKKFAAYKLEEYLKH